MAYEEGSAEPELGIARGFSFVSADVCQREAFCRVQPLTGGRQAEGKIWIAVLAHIVQVLLGCVSQDSWD